MDRGHQDLTRLDFNGPGLMWIFDRRTLAFLAVNDAAVRHYGYSREEFLQMTILDIRPPEDVVPLLRQEMLENRHESTDEQWRHLRRDGSVIDVEITSREVRFNGRLAELVSIRDLTAKPEALPCSPMPADNRVRIS